MNFKLQAVDFKRLSLLILAVMYLVAAIVIGWTKLSVLPEYVLVQISDEEFLFKTLLWCSGIAGISCLIGLMISQSKGLTESYSETERFFQSLIGFPIYCLFTFLVTSSTFRLFLFDYRVAGTFLFLIASILYVGIVLALICYAVYFGSLMKKFGGFVMNWCTGN